MTDRIPFPLFGALVVRCPRKSKINCGKRVQKDLAIKGSCFLFFIFLFAFLNK